MHSHNNIYNEPKQFEEKVPSSESTASQQEKTKRVQENDEPDFSWTGVNVEDAAPGQTEEKASSPESSCVLTEKYSRPAHQMGEDMLGGRLYREKTERGFVRFSYEIKCSEDEANRRKQRLKELTVHRVELVELMSFDQVKPVGDTKGKYAFIFLAPGRLCSLRQLMNDNVSVEGEPLYRFVLHKLLDITLRINKLFGENEDSYLGVFSLDTVFLNEKNQLFILPICARQPTEYPADRHPSADQFAAVVVGLELIDRKPLDPTAGTGPERPDNEILRNCLMPYASMRPGTNEICAYLNRDEASYQPVVPSSRFGWERVGRNGEEARGIGIRFEWLRKLLDWLKTHFLVPEIEDKREKQTETSKEGGL